ncbi:NAD(P)-dependent oxidoreductase [candidate division NPL-UPA2 bacterium]|nr:NAD(P)-dependent oxidoreductase [candidate division NPL-UPA2 bacterium]
MNVLITGGAGVLGSNLASLIVKNGYKVKAMDIVRPEEAWRLEEIIEDIEYLWKSVNDVSITDINKIDVIIDCAIGSADRPFGLSSPSHTVYGNIFPALHLLEVVKHIDDKKRPFIIYSSSFNALYGHGNTKYQERLLPNPSSLYGWTKASAELLYLTYHKAYDIPVVITRTSSAFGPKGRSDELPHKLIINGLKASEKFYLRSPHAKRSWIYIKDILNFYKKLFRFLEEFPSELNGLRLHVTGNETDEIIENIKLAEKIKELTNSNMKIVKGEYEPGEIVKGKPISFNTDDSITRKFLKWKPEYSIEEGLKETINWFKENLWRYNTMSNTVIDIR